VLPLPFSQERRLFRLKSSGLAFDAVRDLQRLVPVPLKLAGNQAISASTASN
jgi:hypothetical protein